MKPIRILHVVGRMHRAGLETFIMNIYRNIDRTRVQFDFLTHYKEKGDYDDEIESLGGKIYRLSVMEDKKFFLYFRQLNSFFKEHQEYNIVHGHWATFGAFYMYFAKRNGVEYRIAHSHNDRMPPGIRGFVINNLIRPMKNLSNHYFACSKPAIKWLFGKNSRIVRNNRVKIIKNSVDAEKFSYDEDIRNEYRKLLNVEEKFVVGHIGRLSYSKNQEFIINVFSRIYESDSNAVLLLIGEGEDRDKLKKLVSDLKLTESIRFLGSKSYIPKLLCAMDVFLFPSHYEALGIVAIEAQASGLPTIVSTAIPKETYVTDMISALPLNAPIEKWVDEVLKNKKTKRKDTLNQIREAGYDAKDQCIYLENFYLSLK